MAYEARSTRPQRGRNQISGGCCHRRAGIRSYSGLVCSGTHSDWRFQACASSCTQSGGYRQHRIFEQTLAVAAYILNDLPLAKQAAQRILELNESDETALEVMAGVAYWQDPGPSWLAPAKRLKNVNAAGSWALILDSYQSVKTDKQAGLQKFQQAKSAKFPNELPYIVLSRRYLLAEGGDYKAAGKEIEAGLILHLVGRGRGPVAEVSPVSA
jgi:hypothetical protein